ncbi:hypothetical protein [Microbacterium sp. M4A5_1d]
MQKREPWTVVVAIGAAIIAITGLAVLLGTFFGSNSVAEVTLNASVPAAILGVVVLAVGLVMRVLSPRRS